MSDARREFVEGWFIIYREHVAWQYRHSTVPITHTVYILQYNIRHDPIIIIFPVHGCARTSNCTLIYIEALPPSGRKTAAGGHSFRTTAIGDTATWRRGNVTAGEEKYLDSCRWGGGGGGDLWGSRGNREFIEIWFGIR